MPSLHFTDAAIRRIKPPKPTDKPNQVSYFDTIQTGLALVLVVSYGGSKSWRVVTYDNGKARSTKIGRYPAISLKDARQKARDLFDNPEKAKAEAETGTFKHVAENWIERHVAKNRLLSQHEIERMLNVYVYPKWATRPFLEIQRIDVNRLLDGIEDNNGAAQADAVLAVIRGIMNWYAARSDSYVTRIVPKMRRDKRRASEKSRSRILDDDEIRAVWNTATGAFGGLTKLLLLTAQRREKVASMKWEDIDGGVWTIPTGPREKGNAGRITLTKMALDILEAQPRLADNPHVFPGRGKLAFNHFSQAKAELDAQLPAPLPDWRLHDLRRTARSLLSRADVRPDIAERLLGHAVVGIAGVYDRHQYEVQKNDALRRLADLVGRIVNPPTDVVVPIRKKRRG